MKIIYNTSFIRDVKKCIPQLRIPLVELLEVIEKARSIQEVADLKKLKGHKTAYRVKLKDYRICLFFENDNLTFDRFLPRKDVYKFFP